MQKYHSSIEGAQHGPKGLSGFAKFAFEASAAGFQPTNFMLEDGKGGFLSPEEISYACLSGGLKLDGVSAHCPCWVHTTAWTGSKTIQPFIPPHVAQYPPERIEQWAEDYLLKLLDLVASLGVKVVPMFWGVAHGWELTTGYPWGFFQGQTYDLIKEGQERFVTKTARLRKHANSLGIKLCHEIHPGTAAMCADDFLTLVHICDDDPCLAVNADPSHCWESESWEQRILKVGALIYGCHVKNHVVRPGFPLRSMQPDWKRRAVQFTDLETGIINLVRYVELLEQVGYPARYCKLMQTKTAPLVTEAESAYRSLDETAAKAIQYTNEVLCLDFSEQSFEDGMGAAES